MKALSALGGGLAGACAVTVIHETVSKIIPDAPRLNLLGMNLISRGLNAAGLQSPGKDKLFGWLVAGDLISNSLYYSLAGVGKGGRSWLRTALVGLAAGSGAILLPELTDKHSGRNFGTKIMTIGIYITGAVVTASVIKLIENRTKKRNAAWEHRLVTSAMG